MENFSVNETQLIQPKNKIKKFFTKPYVAIIITILLIVGAISAGKGYFGNNNEIESLEPQKKQIKTSILNQDDLTKSEITTVGTVKPEAQVEITATTRGTLKGIFFEVGDEVFVNKILASLYDSSTITSLNNAQTNFTNMQNNLSATERNAIEAIRQSELGVIQAEIGVSNSQELINSAEVGVKTAQDSLDNARALKDKSNIDTKNNAIISYNNFLNTIFSTIEQINYILKVEGSYQLPGIENVLGVKDLSTVDKAEADWRNLKNQYNELVGKELTTSNISERMTEMTNALNLTNNLVDDILIVLDNTITSTEFTDTDLTTQKNTYITLRSTVIASQTTAESSLQNLDNLDLVYNQEIEALENALGATEIQLSQAIIGYDSALATLNNAKQALNQSLEGKDQQILNSKSSADNALGQLNLAQAQVGDLTIKAPIKGTITQKYVELGAEINPGQKIAQVSQLDKLKIEASLPSEEIYRAELGQAVIIQDGLEGYVILIDPAADPITRKVKIEISFDNKDKKLIQGTFVDVSIPVKELEKTTENSFFIPLRAVTITQNENFVFVIAEEKAKKVQVKTGKTEGALIEIIEGINNQDELVIDGNKSLEDGDLIEIKN